jgi:DNA-binding Xre family transcriptional regulator
MAIIIRLDRVLADRKMQLNELADKVGISNVNLSNLKTGRVKAVRFSTLNAICRVLNCQPGDILEYSYVEGEELNLYLREKLDLHKESGIGSVVLGCTHYPFIRKELSNILDETTTIIDGSLGTAKQLETQLVKNDILNANSFKGTVEIINSLQSEVIIDLSFKLLTQETL